MAWVAITFWVLCMAGLVLLSAPSTKDVEISTKNVEVSTSSAAYPCAVGQVKGSVSHLYHEPDGRWYAQTRRAVCFDSAADAERAGYREAGGG